jgi:replicative DNA helicase
MFERILLGNLIRNKDYCKSVLDHLKPSYFSDPCHRWVYVILDKHRKQYNRQPTLESLAIDLQNRSDINEKDFRETVELISELKNEPPQDLDWLVNTTEKWAKDKAIENAIDESILILDAEKKNEKPEAPRVEIPTILQKALDVSFKQDQELVSLKTFITNFELPSYLIDDLFLRGWFYTITGKPGSGKTAIALYIAWCIATGTKLGERDVE